MLNQYLYPVIMKLNQVRLDSGSTAMHALYHLQAMCVRAGEGGRGGGVIPEELVPHLPLNLLR